MSKQTKEEVEKVIKDLMERVKQQAGIIVRLQNRIHLMIAIGDEKFI